MSTYNLSIKIKAGVNGQAEVRALEQALAQLKSTGAGVKVNDPTVGLADNAKRAESALGGLMLKFGGLASAVAAVVGPMAALKKGININSEVESAQLGIATIISATTDIKNAQGELVTGPDAFAASIGIAADQMDRLQRAGLKTSATTKQLVDAYQGALGSGSAAGLKLDEILDLTVSITQAAGAMSVPMEQLNQEVRSIFEGQVTADSRVAKILGLKSAELKLWREQGTLAKNLQERLAAYAVAGEAIAQTWTSVTSNMEEALDLFLKKATGGAFDDLKASMQDAMSGAFNDPKAATVEINKELQGVADLAKTLFDDLGSLLAGSVRGGVEGLKDFSHWLDTNRQGVETLLQAIRTMVGEISGLIGDLFADVAGVGDSLANWNEKGGTFTQFLEGSTVMVAGLRDAVDAIVNGLKLLGSGLIAVLTAPIKVLREAIDMMPGNVGSEAVAGLDKALDSMLGKSREMSQEAHNWAKGLADGESHLTYATNKVNAGRENAALKAALAERVADEKAAWDAQEISASQYYTRVEILANKARMAEIASLQALAKTTNDPRRLDAINDKIKGILSESEAGAKRLDGTLTKIEAGATSDPKNTKTEEAAKAEAALAVANADALLTVQKQQLANEEAELSASYERKAIKAEEYYAKLEALQKRAADAEIANIKSKADLETDPAKLAKLEGDIQAIELSKAKISTDATSKLAKEKGKDADSWAKKSARELKVLEDAARSAGQAVSKAQDDFVGDPMKEKGARGYWFQKNEQQDVIDQAGQPAQDQQPGAFATAKNEVQELSKAVASATAPVVQFGHTLGTALSQPDDRLPEVITEVGQLTTALNEAATAAANAAGAVGSISMGSVPGSTVPGFSGGGAVTGPGTGTSDSIMAYLSNGEFVIPADVVRKWGAGHFEQYRQKAPRFAEGGLVGGVQSDIQQSMGGAGASSGRPIMLTVQNEIGDDVFNDWAGSGSADKIFRNQIGKNAKYIKQIVGA